METETSVSTTGNVTRNIVEDADIEGSRYGDWFRDIGHTAPSLIVRANMLLSCQCLISAGKQ